MVSDEIARAETRALLEQRGQLAYGAQMSALEGLPLDDDDARALEAIDAELTRRGVNVSAG